MSLELRNADTYREAERAIAEALRNVRVPEAELQAGRIVQYVSGMTPAAWLMRRDEAMTAEERRACGEILAKRLARVPLQYIFGEQEFCGLPFAVSPAVLIPRADTEHSVEAVLACCEGKSVLDLCTGSGCIAVSVAKLGKPASVTGADISEEALAVAKENALRNGVEIEWIRSDMFAEIPDRYDVIVCNPPYIPPEQLAELEPEVRDYEPRQALYGGEDGLDFYRILAAEAASHLNRGGRLVLEIGFDQGESVPALLEAAGYTGIEVRKDYAGLDRVVIAGNGL